MASWSTARQALAEIRDAEDRDRAEQEIGSFAELCGAKSPKAVATVVDDHEQLLAFDDLSAEHWVHPKTSNPSRVINQGHAVHDS